MGQQQKLTTGGFEADVVYVNSVTFEASGAATCNLRENSPSGTIKATLRLAAAGQVVWRSPDKMGVAYIGGFYIEPTAGSVTVEYGAHGLWSPLDMPDMMAWYDFSDASTMFTDDGITNVSADGQAIYRINNKAPGVDYPLKQTVLGNRPIYKTGIQNGRSVSRTVKASAQILGDNVANLTPLSDGVEPFSVLHVAKPADINGAIAVVNNRWFMGCADPLSRSQMYLYTTGFQGTLAGGGWPAPTAFEVNAWRWSGKESHISEFYRSGTRIGYSTYSPALNPGTTPFTIGGAGGNAFGGDIGMVFVINRRIADGELDKLGRWCTNYWATRPWSAV